MTSEPTPTKPDTPVGETTATEVHVLCPDRSVSVSTVAELDAVLDELTTTATRDERPQWVYLTGPAGWDGPLLSLGLGREFSFLSYGTYYVPGNLDGDESTWWWDGSQGGYSAPGTGVPVSTAREAARNFVRTGQRPNLPNGHRWANDDAC